MSMSVPSGGTCHLPLEKDANFMRFDVLYGIQEFKRPPWRVTVRTEGRLWWKRKIYSAANGIVEIANMDEKMFALFCSTTQ